MRLPIFAQTLDRIRITKTMEKVTLGRAGGCKFDNVRTPCAYIWEKGISRLEIKVCAYRYECPTHFFEIGYEYFSKLHSSIFKVYTAKMTQQIKSDFLYETLEEFHQIE